MPEEILLKAAVQQLLKMGWRYSHRTMQGTAVYAKGTEQFSLTRSNLKNLPQE